VPTGNGTFVTGYGAANAGTGVIGIGTVVDPTAWVPDDYTIVFTTATSWEVRDSASNVIASGSYTSGGAIAFRGIEVAITGEPAAGDTFTVKPARPRDVFSALEALAAALRAPGGTPAERARRRMDLDRALQDIGQGLEAACSASSSPSRPRRSPSRAWRACRSSSTSEAAPPGPRCKSLFLRRFSGARPGA